MQRITLNWNEIIFLSIIFRLNTFATTQTTVIWGSLFAWSENKNNSGGGKRRATCFCKAQPFSGLRFYFFFFQKKS